MVENSLCASAFSNEFRTLLGNRNRNCNFHLLRRSNVRIVDFLGEAQRVERLIGEELARVQMHDHQRFAVPADAVLQQVRQLEISLSRATTHH